MRPTRRSFVVAGLALAGSLLFTGCGGSDSTGPGDSGAWYLRFKANGAQVSFTLQTSLLATFSNAGVQYVGIVTGYDATANTNLQLYDNASITTKTYSGYAASDGAIVGALIGYEDAAGTNYVSTSNQVSVIVTELTGTTIKGTFTAVLSAVGKPDLTVTEGQFFVPRYN